MMPRLIDTTLREGEQSPGLHLSRAAKEDIIAGLVRAGIDEIELGLATAANDGLADLVGYVASHFPELAFSLWCRCLEEDIVFAATLGPPILHLSIPASDLHLAKKMQRGRAWALARLGESVRLARSLGMSRVAVGFEDGSRADPSFLRELAAVAREAGAFRVRIADTVGIADPAMVKELVELLADSGLEVAVHCHNDFGMATANTISAFHHGAHWGDVTLLGLGERAGNSRTEEVMAYLCLQRGMEHYNLVALLELCRRLAHDTGRPVTYQQPVLGTGLFTCQSGLHQQGLLVDPATYEPFAPERVGGQRHFLVGAGVGRHGLVATLERLGLTRPEGDDLVRLWQGIRHRAAHLRRPLHDGEIRQIVLDLDSACPSQAGCAV